MLQQILLIIFPLVAITGVGYGYGRLRRPDMSLPNRINMDVFLPCLIFHALASRSFDLPAYAHLALGGVVVVLGSGVLLLPVARWAKLPVKTFIPPMMFSNAGNMGLPLAVFAFGEEALQAAVVLFVIESGLHFTLGLYIMDRRTRLIQVLKVPFILACLAGLAVNLVGWAVPAVLMNTVQMLGQVSIPLMLFALGVRMVEINFSDWRIGVLGAILGPLTGVAIAAAMLLVLDLDPLQRSMLLVFGALPPAVLNYMIAESYRQDPAKVAAIVMVGNLASVISIPLILIVALP